MIPLATTLIDVHRSDVNYEQYEESTEDFKVIATGVNAHIYAPSGSVSSGQGGTQVTTTMRLISDPIDLKPLDRVHDQFTSRYYNVVSCYTAAGFLPQTTAVLSMVERV